MIYEEFEVKRKIVLEGLTKGISLDEFKNKQTYCKYIDELYFMWETIYGNDLMDEYVEKCGNVDLTREQINKGSQMLANEFIGWLMSYQ